MANALQTAPEELSPSSGTSSAIPRQWERVCFASDMFLGEDVPAHQLCGDQTNQLPAPLQEWNGPTLVLAPRRSQHR